MDAFSIIFTENNESNLGDLTRLRSLAALPIAGRYRVIDFALSSLVNSGIINVGVSTQSNYQSLMDHLGTGKSWDLNRKYYGLFILPPFIRKDSFSINNSIQSQSDMEILIGLKSYISKSDQKYVILCNGNIVCNITFNDAIAAHIRNSADITIAYTEKNDNNYANYHVLELDKNKRITDIQVSPKKPKSKNVSMGMYILEKSLLVEMLEDYSTHLEHLSLIEIIIKGMKKIKVYGFEFDGYIRRIDSIQSYFDCSMDLLEEKCRNELFNSDNRIYTKVKDNVPTKYGMDSKVSNSMVANGCIIEGAVENSILFRGVHIKKGSNVKNSIVMQDTLISEGCELENVILDKEVIIKDNNRLIGTSNYPIVIEKSYVI